MQTQRIIEENKSAQLKGRKTKWMQMLVSRSEKYRNEYLINFNIKKRE